MPICRTLVNAGIKETKPGIFRILNYLLFMVILVYRPTEDKLWRSNVIIVLQLSLNKKSLWQQNLSTSVPYNPAIFLICHVVALYEIFLPNSEIVYILSFSATYPTQCNILNLPTMRLNGCLRILSNKSL